jgi:RHS repeat-associated protein
MNQYLYWNSIGQLDSVKTNGALVSFGYDGAGRRVRKTVGSAAYKYIYDGDQILTIDSSGTRLRTYSYYPGVDQPHSVITSAGYRFYYLSEVGAGSVRGIIDTVGGIKNRYQYAPFGASEVTSEQVVNPFRYTGREYDPETQLYYYRARYYDPSLARFISEDPTGLSSDINQYRYAAGDPINANDPSGTMNHSDLYDIMGSRGGGPFDDVMGPTSFGYSFDYGLSWNAWEQIVAEMVASFAEEDAQLARQKGCANFRDNCEQIKTAIKQLENSGETHCDDLGINAAYRLDRGSLFYGGDQAPNGDYGVYASPEKTQNMAGAPQSWLKDGVIGLFGNAFAGGSRFLFKVLAHEEAHALFGVDDGESQYHAQLSGFDPRNPATGWAVACQGMYDHTNP